ncbi:MAG: hypothetical protein WD715_14945, partial [Dongiaceae bacterium]
MVRRVRKLAAGVLLSALISAGAWVAPAEAQVPETDETIKLVIMGYSGDNIIMYIYGGLLQKLGYNVEFVPADYLGQFAAIEA